MPAVRRYRPSHHYFFRAFRQEQFLASGPLQPRNHSGRYYHPSTTVLSSSKDQHPTNRDVSDTLSAEAHSFPLDRAKTSGRSKKRTKRRLYWKRTRLATNNNNQQETTTIGSELHDREERDDGRTWRTILFPPAYDDGSNPDPPVPWPKSPQAWYLAFGKAWVVYRGTWEGFLSNMSPKPKEEEAVTIQEQKDVENSATMTQKIADNASQNIEMTQEEGGKLLEEVKSKTGIYSLEDVKKLAREMMKVATAMLREFMMEYRKGRDEEVEKMLHEYFQEEEEKEDATTNRKEEEGAKRTKRRPKRRKPSSLTI